MNRNTKIISAQNLSHVIYQGIVGLIRPGLETVVTRKNEMFWLHSVSNPGRLGFTVPGQITPGKRIG